MSVYGRIKGGNHAWLPRACESRLLPWYTNDLEHVVLLKHESVGKPFWRDHRWVYRLIMAGCVARRCLTSSGLINGLLCVGSEAKVVTPLNGCLSCKAWLRHYNWVVQSGEQVLLPGNGGLVPNPCFVVLVAEYRVTVGIPYLATSAT